MLGFLEIKDVVLQSLILAMQIVYIGSHLCYGLMATAELLSVEVVARLFTILKSIKEVSIELIVDYEGGLCHICKGPKVGINCTC